jgi:hypothetical protein
VGGGGAGSVDGAAEREKVEERGGVRLWGATRHRGGREA